MQRMFSRFFRASNATAQAIPGTGLGLAIADQLSRALGGRLTLANREGGGLRAALELPRENAAVRTKSALESI